MKSVKIAVFGQPKKQSEKNYEKYFKNCEQFISKN